MILQVVEILEAGGIVAYPTDSGYALGCRMGNKKEWIESGKLEI
jgi:tRNA A37 threonylcarbamoyladenosine synthetase subunit TsaC/SUA5/YrdC